MINDDEFIALPRKGGSGIWKFTVSTNRWTPIMKLKGLEWNDCVRSADYDKDSNTLFVVTDHIVLLSIDMETAEIKIVGDYVSENRNLSAWHPPLDEPELLLIGDNRHVFGMSYYSTYSERHIAVHYVEPKNSKVTRSTNPVEILQFIQDETEYEDCPIRSVDKFKHSESRNSIIAFCNQGTPYHNRNGYESMIIEYSLDCQRWTRWPKMKWVNCMPLRNGEDTVITNDGRYIISVGSWRHWKGELEESDKIIVYDSKKMICGESKAVIPRSGFHKAVMMVNRTQDTLLAQAYVNQSYRETEFKGLTVLPVYLIDMIGKWFCNEYLHIFLDCDDDEVYYCYDGHFKINVDDIVVAFL